MIGCPLCLVCLRATNRDAGAPNDADHGLRLDCGCGPDCGSASCDHRAGAGAQSLTYTKGRTCRRRTKGGAGTDGSKILPLRVHEPELGSRDRRAGRGRERLQPRRRRSGQPTHFLPRRNRFVFRVKVPSGFGEKDELVWTLTTHGKTEKAYATLRPDYVVDDVVKARKPARSAPARAVRKCAPTTRRRCTSRK